VTNCNRSTTSNRNAFVEELQKHLTVDIFGRCGDHECPGNHPNEDPCYSPIKCYETMGPKYKFYLSLENSICPEYITEKFFFPLGHGMVPVVLGPSRKYYEALAPPNSFLHVDDYPSVKDLAEHMLLLDKQTRVYQNHLMYKTDYVLDDEIYFRRAWCTLCEKLHLSSDEENKTYGKISDWWMSYEGQKNATCKRMKFDDRGMYKIK